MNLFVKQLARCPYLVESEEFYLFIRPHIELEKALTLLPKLNAEEMLQRVSKYYSFMGQISETKVMRQMNQIFAFVKTARHHYAQLEKFKEVVDKMIAHQEQTHAIESKLIPGK